MKYKAEIFDKFFFLYDKTGYSDHQLHCILYFNNHLNAERIKRAAALLMKAVPILSRVYRDYGGEPYWEDACFSEIDFFTIVNDTKDFERFTFSRTDEAAGPQLKVCLLRQPEGDSLSLVMNHMVCDAVGFKECLYLLSEIYSDLFKNPDAISVPLIDGDRSFKKIGKALSLPARMKIYLRGYKDRGGEYEFPFSRSGDTSPFIAFFEIKRSTYQKIRNLCAGNHVTVNDVVLTAFVRVLSGMLDRDGEELAFPIMVDMRRYLRDKSFNALTNLTANSILRITVTPGENFDQTLEKVNAAMSKKKLENIGIDVLLTLEWQFKLYGKKTYSLLEKAMDNPKIGMTNIGVLDAKKLMFKDSSVINAVMCGSIKYRPYFQLSVSTFKDIMTLCVNLYGDDNDRRILTDFFLLMEYELESIS